MKSHSLRQMPIVKRGAHLGKQIASGLVDAGVTIAAVLLLLVCLSMVPLFYPLVTRSTSLQVAVLTGLVFYRFLMLWQFNSTFGMQLLRITLLNSEQQPLTVREKVLAAFFILYKGAGYYNR